MIITAVMMIGPDRQQTGVFPLRSGVRLQGNRVKTGDVAELGFQIVDQFLVAFDLIGGLEGMNATEA